MDMREGNEEVSLAVSLYIPDTETISQEKDKLRLKHIKLHEIVLADTGGTLSMFRYLKLILKSNWIWILSAQTCSCSKHS